MRRFFAAAAMASLAAWLLIGIPVLAEEKDAGKKPRDAAQVQPKEKTRPDDARKKKSPGWPRPFKPTEEISADSIVPFPTDI